MKKKKKEIINIIIKYKKKLNKNIIYFKNYLKYFFLYHFSFKFYFLKKNLLSFQISFEKYLKIKSKK
jgi:hypothetical protein